jgi:hypothetical protein
MIKALAVGIGRVSTFLNYGRVIKEQLSWAGAVDPRVKVVTNENRSAADVPFPGSLDAILTSDKFADALRGWLCRNS